MCAEWLSSLGMSSSIKSGLAKAAKYKAFGDIGLFFGLLLLLELLLPGDARLSSINPHPFWIPVLLVSAQHGSRAGLAAATVATSLVVLWMHPVRHPTEDFYTYTTQLFIEPVLWVAAALFLGLLRDQHIAEKRELQAQAETLLKDQQLIGEHSLGLARRIKLLERHIASTDAASTREAFRLLAELSKASDEHIMSRLEAAAAALLGPYSVLSVHQQKGTTIHSKIVSSIRQKAAIPDRHADYANTLLSTLHNKPRNLSFLVQEDTELLDRALFAVPLFSKNVLTPVGVLSCEVLDPKCFDLAEQAQEIVIAMETLAAAFSSARDLASLGTDRKLLLNPHADAA